MIEARKAMVFAATLFSLVFAGVPACAEEATPHRPTQRRYTDLFAGMADKAPLQSAFVGPMHTVQCQVTPCSLVDTTIYGIDLNGTVEVFAFNTGISMSVPTPGDVPFGPDGLAVAAPDDAFWISSFGLDMIFEFDPTDGSLIAGVFPLASPGSPGATDGLAMVEPGRLFSLNYADDTIYEIDTASGAVVNALDTGATALGGLAGGVGRLFAVLDFTVIGELDPDTGTLLGTFSAPDLDGDGFPDTILGLAFDGRFLFTASADAVPPNVAAVDPDTGDLLAVSPFVAPSGVLSALDAVASVCGDGVTSPLEACDDGGLVDGDGCDSNCTPTGCGNGITTAGEDCDDGGESNVCDSDCTSAACGDGDRNTTSGEICDDANPQSGDGCSAACQIETCYRCENLPSECTIDQGAPCFVAGNTCEPGKCNASALCADAVVLADGAGCEDGLPCTLGDRCSDGTCVTGSLRDCRAFDSDCTIGACDENTGQCRADTSEREGNACDDGLFCTVDDTCADGACSGKARDCSGLDDACSLGECDESAEQCVAVTVVDPADCSDDNPCTDDVCDPAAGCESFTNALPCDDDDPCTIDDHCTEGQCRGEEHGCADNNACTYDNCEAGIGCRHTAILGSCTDINRCTAGDACLVGRCEGAPLSDCERHCGDVTGDGIVTVVDALAMLRLVTAGIACDPVECDLDSNRRADTTDVLAILRIIVRLLDHGNCPLPSEIGDAGPEIEPNDDLEDATPIDCPFETVGAEINPRGDLDFYSFTIAQGDVVAVDIDARSQGSNLDSVAAVLDEDRDILALSDDDTAPGEPLSFDSYLEFQAPATGKYFIGVTSCCDFTLEGGSGLGSYVMACRKLDVTVTTTHPVPTTTVTSSTSPAGS